MVPLMHGIYNPTQNDFLSIPHTIYFQQFLDRCRLSATAIRVVVGVKGTKHFVHCTKKGPFDATTTILIALNKTKKIVNINVLILERVLYFVMGGGSWN